jgi:hypothetical protein
MPEPWQGKRPVAVVTACQNADGTPDFAFNEVEITHDEYENGVHYDLVEDRLQDSGYEEPFVHFDQFDAPAFLHPAVRQYLNMAPWVVRPRVPVVQEER